MQILLPRIVDALQWYELVDGLLMTIKWVVVDVLRLGYDAARGVQHSRRQCSTVACRDAKVPSWPSTTH